MPMFTTSPETALDMSLLRSVAALTPACRGASRRVAAVPAQVEGAEPRVLLSGGGLTTVAAGDFNADGSADTVVWVGARQARAAKLAVAGAGLRRGSLAVLDSNGFLLGGLSIRARGNLAPLTAAADFNEDGNLDLVVASRRLSGVRSGLAFLAGNGDGTFATAVPIANAPANVTSLAASDVDGDGHADLVGTARSSNRNGSATTGGNLPLVLDKKSHGKKLWTISDGGNTADGGNIPGNPDRPHMIGVGAEAGGGVLDGSA